MPSNYELSQSHCHQQPHCEIMLVYWIASIQYRSRMFLATIYSHFAPTQPTSPTRDAQRDPSKPPLPRNLLLPKLRSMPRLPSALKSGRLISALLGACCNTAFGIIGLYNPSFSLRIVAGAFGAVGIFLTLIPAYLDATKPSPHLSPSKSSSDLEMGYKDRGITDASDEALHHSAEPISRSTSLSPSMAPPSRHRLERYTDTPEPTSPVSNASEVSTGHGESSDEADTEPLVHTQSTPPVSLNAASIFRPDLLSPELNGAPRSELNQLATKYNLDVKYVRAVIIRTFLLPAVTSCLRAQTLSLPCHGFCP
ncbi:hypothetical protein DL93DRAFT_723535 [Clavulina sp. PMI_390]|nr:hypothetical protein DL93DRAFT_723535 [Clavulina sp. PMI_390]